jgi:alpha-galactosidase
VINSLFKQRIVKLSVAAIIGCGLVGANPLASQTAWLDQLDLSQATQGYGAAKKNTSIDGRKMTVGGKTFERGLGTHAESSLLIKLDGKA